MGTFFVRIEAVNLNHFVYDTNNLSTIRGASTCLLEWPGSLEKALKQYPDYKLELVTRGASTALIKVDTDQESEALLAKAEAFFREHRALRHATFVVDAIPKSGDFTHDRQRLIALNRKRQMSARDLAVRVQSRQCHRLCGF